MDERTERVARVAAIVREFKDDPFQPKPRADQIHRDIVGQRQQQKPQEDKYPSDFGKLAAEALRKAAAVAADDIETAADAAIKIANDIKQEATMTAGLIRSQAEKQALRLEGFIGQAREISMELRERRQKLTTFPLTTDQE